MRNTMTVLIAGALIIMAFTACKKEKIKGCTVSYATNFKSDAEEDDGSCNYEAKIIFWQNQTNAVSWSSVGVTTLKFYVDGQSIGSCFATSYNNSTPTCAGNGQASTIMSLGSSKTKAFTFSIKDQDGSQWYSGSISLNGETCSTKQFN